MTDWLYDTLLWTGVLIGLVLLIRRPVAKAFGPRVAYALWFIPFIRLILPPLVLPAWMAPEQAPAIASTVESAASVDPVTLALAEQAASAPVAQQAAAGPVLDPAMLTALTLALWLGGAAVFLFTRFKGYRDMREEMLEDAKEVGVSDKVRLMETPAATAPLAFGVKDKVVALPPGFLAMHDRETRDLAVAHELAHHRGGDLLVNMLMQPLFAMHWFNPLGYYGWQALRRDQESACDARVVEHCPEEKRADYARVIASFAAGPNVALAAPMACPVLGEKSIIERLRSLKMSQHTSQRRKTGAVLLAGALIALPLTATVSYAEGQSVEEAFAEEAVTPPAPPAPPEAPGAPTPPAPPAPPEVGVDVDVEMDADGNATKTKNVYRTVSVYRSDDGEVKQIKRSVRMKGGNISDEEKRTIEMRVERAHKDAMDAHKASDKAHAKAHKEAMRAHKEAAKANARAHKEMRIALAESVDARAEAERAIKEVRLELEGSEGGRTTVEMKCEGDEIASEKTREDGTNVVMICKSKVMAEALKGLKQARAEIAKNSEMDAETRKEVLRSLDEQIENWNS
ncbi:M56 family metallopeptidase [Erythrobacter sp. HA6-11]